MDENPKKVVKVVKTKPMSEGQAQAPSVEEPKVEPIMETGSAPTSDATPSKPETPIYKQWWFWLIAAALAIGIFFLGSKTGGTKTEQPETTTVSSDVAVATVTTTTTTVPVNTFKADEVLQQLQVTPYRYSGEYSDGEHFVLQIKNNSEYTLDVTATATYYDAGNNMVGTDQDTEYDIPAGKEFAMDFYNDSKFDHVDHVLSVKQTERYEPVAQNLSIESQNIAGDKIVFTVKNNGNLPVDFPKVTALFFRGDQLVDTDYTYASPDGSSLLGPGESINKELDSYDTGFDRVLLFLTGESE